MGGVTLEVRGKNKGQTFARFLEKAKDNPLPDIYPDPKNKKMCKRMMKQDPETGDWVLLFRFQK